MSLFKYLNSVAIISDNEQHTEFGLSRKLSLLPRGVLLYNRGYGCASGTFKPLPFTDQNFGKLLDPL